MAKEKKVKKEKQPSTNKKSFSQKITGINTTSEISYGNVVVNPKDKRVKWLFGVSIFSLLAIGIGVPLGMAGVQYIAAKPYLPETEVYPGGPTVGDMVEENKDKEKIDRNAEKIETIIVKKLYNEERDAFLRFEAFVNNTKYRDTSEKVGPTTFGVDVSKSYDDVWKSQEKELNNAKRAIRESFPLDWAKRWNDELKSDKYGNANTDKEAIDFLTKNKVKDAAFARFNTAEINTTSWTQADLSLQARQNITYKNDAGEEKIIPAGTQMFSSTFLDPNGDNIAIPSDRDPVVPSSEVKIAVYQTKSYVLEERNPLGRLPNLYNDYFKSVNISSVAIPFLQNESNSEFELSVTQDLLISLFTISRAENGDLVIPFNTISNFKGANTSSVLDKDSTRRAYDKANINTLSQSSSDSETLSTRKPATTGSNLGSSQVSPLSTLIKSEENEARAFHVAAISAMTNPTADVGLFKAKEFNPINKFLESILTMTTSTHPGVSPRIINLVEFLNDQLKPIYKINPQPGEEAIEFTSLKNNIDLFKYNKDLRTKVRDIAVDDFSNTFNKLLTESFKDLDPYGGFIGAPTATDVNDVPKKWTVYKIDEDTYLYVDAKGLQIYNVENLIGDSLTNPALKMLKSDIQNTIDVTNNPDQVILYNVASQYNNIATPEIINKILIEENKDYVIAELEKEGESPDKANQIVEEVYDDLINVINNTINPDVKSALEGLSTFIEELIKPMNSYDFYEVTKPTTGVLNLEFMNNSQYINGSLEGYLLIESQFDDKLRALISVQVKKNLLPFTEETKGRK
ncbi:MAG: HinT-interacting membrane complex protein P80 [Metamycoplasmataceae bacterium]